MMLIIVIIIVLCALLLYNKYCSSDCDTYNYETYENMFDYAINARKTNMNKINNFDKPYKMFIDNDAKNKIMNLYDMRGVIIEPHFKKELINTGDPFLGLYPLTDNIPKWEGEMVVIEPVNEYNIDKSLVTNYGKLADDCGSHGNICSSDYDCCNGLHCHGNRCQQI